MKTISWVLSLFPLQVAIAVTAATYVRSIPAAAQTPPIVPAADGTGTVVAPSGERFDITGGKTSRDGANLFHSFQQFGLSEGQIANFISNPAIRNIFGQTVGGSPSFINGLLQVSGGNSNLFLINPAGIVFGQNASLNVPAALTATTANGIGFDSNNWLQSSGPNNWEQLTGNPNIFAFTTNQPGGIVNFGNLAVGQGQTLNLLGGTVLNAGQLTAPSGQITIAAVPGESLVRLSQPGHLLSLEIQPLNGTQLPVTNPEIPIPSIPQLLTGSGEIHASRVQVNPDGTVQLTAGGPRIPAGNGNAIASGAIDTSATANPGVGGAVNILGSQVAIVGASISASGASAGGTIRIGGDYKGQGTIPNALRTFTSSDSTIDADASLDGNGGRVIIWSDETTRFLGNISARGGSNSGDGGFVEVSGKQNLDFQGIVDLRAPFGNLGTLLLDPTDITIGGSPTDSGGTLSSIFTPSAATSTISIATLLNNLALGNVTISTASTFGGAGDITVSEPVSWNNANSLTLQADNNIAVNAQIANSGTGALDLQANNTISVNQNITTAGGNITINADRDGLNGGAINFNNATVNSGGGSIILGGGNNPLTSPAVGIAANPVGINLNNSNLNAAGGNISLRGSGFSGTGNNFYGISLAGSQVLTTANGNITLNGSGGAGGTLSHGINMSGSSVSSENGNISITGTNPNSSQSSGISIDAGSVRSTGTGAISLTGTGGTGTVSNNGIVVAGGGQISSGSGAINLTGTGGATTSRSDGVSIDGTNTNITSSSGTINITGNTNAATGYGITIFNNAYLGTGAAGNIALTGTGTGTFDGINIATGGAINPVSFGAGGSVSLTADEMNLAGIIRGSGTLLLQPLSPSLGISIGGNVSDSRLNFNSSGINNIQPGFAQILVGRADSNGAISVNGGVNFNAPTTIRSPLGNGTIDINTAGANITGTGSLTLQAAGTISSANTTILSANLLNFTVNADADGSGGGAISLAQTNINTNGGNITLGGGSNPLTQPATGTATNPTGVNIVNSNFRAGNGNISIRGVGVNGRGVNVDSSNLQVTGTGNIAINGTASGTSGTANTGVALANGPINTSISAANGNITIEGNTTSPQNASKGVEISGVTVESTGTGNIQVTGNSTGGAVNGTGIIVNQRLSSAGGNISLTGTSRSQNGVEINSPNVSTTAVETAGTGNITISGTGAVDGVAMRGNAVNNSRLQTQGTGNITVVGSGTSGQGIALRGGSINPAATGGSGNIRLQSDKVFFDAASRVNGTGLLEFVPLTSDLILNIGTTTLGNTFPQINVGNSATNGTITFSGNANFNNPVSIQATAAGGEINSAGYTIAGTGNATIDLNANGSIVTGNIINPGRSIAINSNNGSIDTTAGIIDTHSTSGGGNIAITSAGNISVSSVQSRADNTGTSGSIRIESTAGKITATGAIDTSSRNTASANNVRIAASGNVSAQTVSAAATGNGTSGNAAGVTISSNTGTIATGTIDAQSNRINGNAGTVNLNSARGITAADIFAFTDTAAGNAGSAGAINLAAANGNIVAGNVLSSTRAASGNAGNAGNFTATATNGDITLANIHSGAYVFGTGAAGNAGTVSVNAGDNLTVSGRVDATSFGTVSQGTPGNIELTAGHILSANSINTLQTDLLPATSATVRYGNIALTGNEIDLTGGQNRVISTGTIALQPFLPDRNIVLGGADNSGTDTLDLTAADLAALPNGFSSIAIGRSNSSGTISLTENVTFNDPVTIQSPATSGSIDTRGFKISGADNATINLLAGGNIFTGSIGNPGRSIAINSTAGSIDTSGRTLNTSSANSNGGPISLTAKNEIKLGAIDTSTSAPKNTATAGTISIDSGSRNIILTADIDTSAATGSGTDLNFNGNVRLDRTIAIDTSGSHSSGSISFNNSLDATTPGNQSLTLNAGTGNITFNGAVGGSTSLGNLTANTNGTTAFNNNVSATSLTTNAGGTTQLRGNINTSGSQNYGDPVAIANNPILTSSEISFNNTVSGNSNLTVNAGTGNITFSGAVGDRNPLQDLTANTSGTTAFNNNVTAASLTTNAGGTTELKGNVNTSGSQTYSDAVSIANNPILTGSEISFNSTVDGSTNLTVNSEMGNITFSGAVGGSNSLRDLIANSSDITSFNNNVRAASLTTNAGGKTELKGNVNTSGSQTYSDAVRIANNPILTGSNITFNSTVDGSSNLTVNSGTGNITFSGAVGGNSTLGDLTANSSGTTAFHNAVRAASLTTNSGGTTQLKGNVNTSGSQTYSDAVRIANNPILTGSNITFNSTLDGSSNLTVNSETGNITFSGAVGGSNPLGDLTANTSGTTAFNNNVTAASLTTDAGGTTQLKDNVNTSGSQTYSDAVRIANNPILTGSNITFNSTVDGSSNLTVNSGTGNITFSGAVGGSNPLGDLTANSSGTTVFNRAVRAASLITNSEGKTQLNANVNTSENQIYGDAVTAANNPILTGKGITFNNTVNGNSNLTVNAGEGGIVFNGAIGNISRLGDLTANSQSDLASGTIAAANIDLTAGGSVTAGNLEARSAAGNGGRIGLDGQSITAGNINTRGSSGGSVNASANGAIAIGRIDTRGTTSSGGSVTLGTSDSIRVVSIDTSGGTPGTGGSVDVTAGNFFQATGVFTNQNGLNTSISTQGSAITIRHGGSTTTPFVIGDATVNGTTGAISSDANNAIAPTFAVPVPPSTYTVGNINIITSAPPAVPSPVPSPTPQPSPQPSPAPIPTPIAPSPTPQPVPTPLPQPVPTPQQPSVPAPPATTPQQPIAPAPPATTPQQPIVPAPPATTPQQPIVPAPPATTPQQPIAVAGLPDPAPTQQQPILAAPPTQSVPAQQQPIVIGPPTQPVPTQQQPTVANPPTQPVPTQQNPDPGSVTVPPPTAGSESARSSPNNSEIGNAAANGSSTSTGAPENSSPNSGTVGSRPILVIEESSRPVSENTNTQPTLTVENNNNSPASSSSASEISGGSSQILRLETPNSANILAAPKSSKLQLSLPATGKERTHSLLAGSYSETRNIRLSTFEDSDFISLSRSGAIQKIDEGNIDTAVEKLEILAENLYAKYWGLTEADGSTKSIQNIRETLATIESKTGNRSAIIYTVVRSDRLDLILVTATGQAFHRAVRDTNSQALVAAVTNLRSEITNPIKRRTTSYLAPAKKLYQWLIAPLETELKNQKIDTLLFSLDSGLKTLPLAALHDGKQFLIEKYSISTIPSLSLTDTSYQSLAGARLLAMGASVFSEQEPLPAVPTELQNITAEWPGKYFLNETFTLNNLKSQRATTTPRIIHLATHGEFRSGPSDSYIQLWDSQLLMSQIGQLSLSEPPVELLVLSACRTAVGDDKAELGFAGFAFQAGVKSVLASLWYVSDEGSLALMTDFYSQLRNYNIKAEALRQTQIDMIRGTVNAQSARLRGLNFVASNVASPPQSNSESLNMSHPYYWSGFTMIGSPW
ncbi:MAG: CHAT domain-containing protein [Oscillatoriaceae cyanobacterium Prado104]|jgi:CHAT domain-containing protein|nr:CHAT domain-containing protein [Oscillatoriaceae cyanobacterium Prado104]